MSKSGYQILAFSIIIATLAVFITAAIKGHSLVFYGTGYIALFAAFAWACHNVFFDLFKIDHMKIRNKMFNPYMNEMLNRILKENPKPNISYRDEDSGFQLDLLNMSIILEEEEALGLAGFIVDQVIKAKKEYPESIAKLLEKAELVAFVKYANSTLDMFPEEEKETKGLCMDKYSQLKTLQIGRDLLERVGIH